MQIVNDIIYGPDGIGEHVISYYQYFFSDPSDSSLDLLIVWEHVPSLVISEENASMHPPCSFL